MVSTFAGSSDAGCLDGHSSVTTFSFPRGIAIDADGAVYVADSCNYKIRKIYVDGMKYGQYSFSISYSI